MSATLSPAPLCPAALCPVPFCLRNYVVDRPETAPFQISGYTSDCPHKQSTQEQKLYGTLDGHWRGK